MNYPVHNNKGGNGKTKKSGSRLERDGKIYDSAGEALEAYIAQFEGRSTNYRRRPSDLLSPKPKYYFMDSLERKLKGSASRSPARKADELLDWVNHLYTRDLSSRVEAYGAAKSDSASENHKMRDLEGQRRYPPHAGRDDELSTLPSPSSSVVDLESNAGTVETEVLLSSFKGARPPGSYTRNVSFKSPSKYRTSSYSKAPPPKSSSEYPSWVSSLGKEYPSWVEDLDSTTLQSARQPARSPQTRRTPEAPDSASTLRKSPYTSPLRTGPALKVSDLHPRDSPSHLRSKTTQSGRSPRGGALIDDMLDSASVDTDVLLSQPIYGSDPVNMGGNLHKSLYEDKKVARLKKESTKKLRKGTSRTRQGREPEKSPSQRLRSLDHNSRSPRMKEHITHSSPYRDSTPLKPTDFYLSARKQRESLPSKPSRYSLSPESHSYGATNRPGRRSASPRLVTEHQSPSVSRKPFFASSYRSIGSSASVGQPPASSQKYFSHSPIRRGVPLQKEESDAESVDTEKDMRKSPTGIRMEKIYRDPSTMHPWKTMIQSSRSIHTTHQDHSPYKNVMTQDTFDDRTQAHAGYENTYMQAHSPHTSPHWRARGPITDQHVEDVKSTPKPIFASSGYASSHRALKKTAAGHAKPPLAPGSDQRRTSHRRSKTVPDLRRFMNQNNSGPSWRAWTGRRQSMDDEQSVDTELLVTQPPMPIVDVSPSLTTVSDSDTMVESESDADTEFHVPSRGGLGRAEQVSLSTPLYGADKFSPTSAFASSNPRAAVTTELPQRFQLWKLDEDSKASDGFIKQRFTGAKSNIISSFLEDCLSVDENESVVHRGNSSPVVRLSGKEAAPGPVEALKQMLFTMQDMAHHEMDQQHEDYSQPRVSSSSKRWKDVDFSADDESERTSEILRGEVSLQRAYRHLERLKRLVGAEDDKSSASSVT